MSNDIYDVSTGEPILTATGLMVPELRAIHESGDKSDAYLAYIYHMVNPLSPYVNLELGMRHDELVIDCLDKKRWNVTKIVQKGLDKYASLITTTEIRALQSAEIMCDNLSKYFKSIDFTEEDEKGALKHDARKAVQNLKDMSGLVESLMSLKKQVEKGLQEKANNNRAGAEFNMFEKGKG